MKWLDRLLLGLGAALVLAGVVFFFAFNWGRITPFEKFGLIEAGIAACALGAFFREMGDSHPLIKGEEICQRKLS